MYSFITCKPQIEAHVFVTPIRIHPTYVCTHISTPKNVIEGCTHLHNRYNKLFHNLDIETHTGSWKIIYCITHLIFQEVIVGDDGIIVVDVKGEILEGLELPDDKDHVPFFYSASRRHLLDKFPKWRLIWIVLGKNEVGHEKEAKWTLEGPFGLFSCHHLSFFR